MTTIGDFNTKSKNWYCQDKFSFEGKTFEKITSQCGLYQLTNELTCLLEHSSTCSFYSSRPNIYIAAKFGSRIKCSLISLF